jgi:hypothetical protein
MTQLRELPDGELRARVNRLDCNLFSAVESQTTDRDRRSLLALHSAVAAKRPSFSYLEIGSYLGGSLQVVVRDSRCARVISIDTRTSEAADKRLRMWSYEDNSTGRMLELLSTIPDVNLGKISTFTAGTDELRPADLPARPDYCFIDGEHTDHAALRDARFCADALADAGGVIAFHDCSMVGPGIRTFVKEAWGDISIVLAFNGEVFAIELGDSGILRSSVIDRAIESKWHTVGWRMASRSSRSALPLLALWSGMGPLDTAICRAKETARRAISRTHDLG